MRRIGAALLLAGSLAGQPVATPPPSPWTRWGTDFTLLADGYVDGNFNNPASGFKGLRNFDVRADTAHFSMGMLTIDHGPAPVGFHLDAGFGEAFDMIHAADKAPDELKYIQQAYVSLKPKSWHGVSVLPLRHPRIVSGRRPFHGRRTGGAGLEQRQRQ
jgi:hypothetical protein